MNSMEIGRCIDKEKYDGRAHSVRAIINRGMKVEKMLKTNCLKRLMAVGDNMIMRTWMPSCRRLGMMCLVLPWTRPKEIQYIKDKKFWRGSLEKKLYAERTRS